MEVALLALALAALAVLAGLAVARLPFGRWEFTHRGRRYEVLNHVLSERIRVDGQVLADTRMATDRFSYATHAIALPEGGQLEITLRSSGVAFRCVACVGGEVVYDSERIEIGQARARLPAGPVPSATEGEPPDPRWPAARLLLAELTGRPHVAEAARALHDDLLDTLRRGAQARRAAEAHAALGGADADLAAIVDAHAAAADERFALLRQLHRSVQEGAAVEAAEPAPAAPAVEEALRRVAAAREVEGARAARVRAGST